ncbi:MAG: hypothetical protein PHS16_02405 [Candidatus Colwellbacteria bacterium]|jgi:hypothetical protein|nr:hypothetical protein [Candidatus Colwellbacteria bacterium]MCK9497794.1 hypothetical protein [Candidatus Colwellbacteria bacterium]MDD3752762.1 hypothetical protein [Candidatus Colwellbacteria bacterium]
MKGIKKIAKKAIKIAVLLIIILTLLFLGFRGMQTNTDKEKAIVQEIVFNFGSKLKNVSLLAPEDNLKESILDNYNDYVDPVLLNSWLDNTAEAPGRLTSSPWPEKIDISEIKKIGSRSYKISGDIIEVTNIELERGGFAAKKPITLSVAEKNGKWVITNILIGEYEGGLSYRNNEYGFSFSLPESWLGYSIVNSSWRGDGVGGPLGVEEGPIVSIRHPEWTEDILRQDIPIMIFTASQWTSLQNGEFHIGAAPIGPRELGRNSEYVFALPARYNFAFPVGFEEVEEIINSGALTVF